MRSRSDRNYLGCRRVIDKQGPRCELRLAGVADAEHSDGDGDAEDDSGDEERESRTLEVDKKKTSRAIEPNPPSTRRNPDLNFHLDCFTGGANLTTRALGSATKHSATESPKRRLGRTAIHSS